MYCPARSAVPAHAPAHRRWPLRARQGTARLGSAERCSALGADWGLNHVKAGKCSTLVPDWHTCTEDPGPEPGAHHWPWS